MRYYKLGMKSRINQFITLENQFLKVELCSLGASLYRIIFNNKDMLVASINKEDIKLNNYYFGKTIGRVCGRLPINYSKEYKLEDNDNSVSLHGGFNGLSNQYFDVEKQDNKVIFSYLSKDNEAGYPGNLLIKVIYELIDNTLRVNYLATCDKPCLLALTNHSYFSLGEDDKDNLYLKIKTDKYIEVDDRLLPVRYQPLPKRWDFNDYKCLKECGDIDNSFILLDSEVSLKSKKYQMDIKTDYKAVQIFTDHFPFDFISFNSKNNKYRGLAIEPQGDQLNRKELLIGQTYNHYISYTFKKL